MLEIIKVLVMVVSVLLVLIVLIQPKKSSLNLTTFGNEGGGKFERRGPEKTLHQLTIGLGVLYVGLCLAYFFMS